MPPLPGVILPDFPMSSSSYCSINASSVSTASVDVHSGPWQRITPELLIGIPLIDSQRVERVAKMKQSTFTKEGQKASI